MITKIETIYHCQCDECGYRYIETSVDIIDKNVNTRLCPNCRIVKYNFKL